MRAIFTCQLLTRLWRGSPLMAAAICLLIITPACKQKTDYTKEISRLDSSSAVLLVAEKNLWAVDTVTLSGSYNDFSQRLKDLTDRLSTDTVNKRSALILSAGYEQTGNIHNLLENKKYLERAVQEAKQRMDDLKHDLKENLIEKNKSLEYIVHEVNSTAKICDAVNRSIEKAKIASMKLDSMKTQIIFLADSIK